MIYEGVFISFDLVLSLVAVLIVPGGFKGGCLFNGPRFLPPWAELADPSPVLVEKRGVHVGDLSSWLDPRPLGWGALAGKAEIFGRFPPPLPFGTWVPDCPPAEEPVAAFYFAGRGLAGSSSELSSYIGLLLLIVSIYDTRTAQHYHIPPVKFDLAKTGIRYRGAVVWNAILSDNTNTNVSEAVFKKVLKRLLSVGILYWSTVTVILYLSIALT